VPLYFASDFAKILTDFENSFTGRLSNKFLLKQWLKYDTKPQTRRYTILW